MKTVTFAHSGECLDFIIILRLKLAEMRKLYREVEMDDTDYDWQTQEEILVELASTAVGYKQMIETIKANMSLHVYPFNTVDRR